MMLTSLPLAGKSALATLDSESDLIQCVVDSVTVGDSHANRTAIVNLLVVLKSKRMVLLVDDVQNHGTALIRALTRTLFGDNHLQCQILTGHPWWVGVPGASNVLTTFHPRFVTDKILAILEEASDLAIEQVLLTRSREKIRSSRSFHLEMYDLLRPFPRSRAFFGAV